WDSVVLHVDPVSEPRTDGMLLVVFDDRAAELRGHAYTHEGPSSEAIAELRNEFEQTNERLRTLLDARQFGQEELADANSTLRTLNDELRDVLEELEGSREDLQAANEELATLDKENRRRLDELTQISADLQHLLESTGIGALFLDRDL